MMAERKRSGDTNSRRNDKDGPFPMLLDSFRRALQKRLGRDSCSEYLALRRKASGLSGLERKRSIPVDGQNLHLAGGT
jgi:hypothetical protein